MEGEVRKKKEKKQDGEDGHGLYMFFFLEEEGEMRELIITRRSEGGR